MKIKEKIATLLKLMNDHNIDTYIITKLDPHQTEYSIPHFNGVAFISGFTGSYGKVVVTKNEVGLFTDGRYYIQAAKELDGSGITLFKEGQPQTISLAQYCKQQTPLGGTIGFDGRTISKNEADEISKEVQDIKFVTNIDLLDPLWIDRPSIPNMPVFEHDIKYAGKSVLDKLTDVREKMKQLDTNMYIISSLDDIAWLFNLRGSDISNMTVFFAYAIITFDKAILFTDHTNLKLPNNVEIQTYEDIYSYTPNSNAKILFCSERTCLKLYNHIKDYQCKNIDYDITTTLKSIKNNIEIQNTENAYIKDGIAMVRFIKWLKETVRDGSLTEYDVCSKVLSFRQQQDDFISESFSTICAYMSNAAMMHYHAYKDNCADILPQGILLVDSGGHYLDGTTDITRTIVLGDVHDDIRKHFTLVLKSVIALSSANFLYGATGTHLDTIARTNMWQHYMDYKSGTGHGIGFCLNVHEGPHRVSPRLNDVAIEDGMVFTIEPGVYIEGKYGIRTENVVVCEENIKNDFGTFMKLKTITFCPIDIDAIVPDMLTGSEKDWINNYHKDVYDKLAPYLTEEERQFLRQETREIL